MSNKKKAGIIICHVCYGHGVLPPDAHDCTYCDMRGYNYEDSPLGQMAREIDELCERLDAVESTTTRNLDNNGDNSTTRAQA